MRWLLLMTALLACEGPAGPPGLPGPLWDGQVAVDRAVPDRGALDRGAMDGPDAPPADMRVGDAVADANVSDGGTDAVVDAGLPDCPAWTAPAGLGGPADAVLTLEEVQHWRDFRAAREQQRLLEAWRPAVVRARFRPERSDCLTLAQRVDLGRALFMRAFSRSEGFGNGGEGLRRFQVGLEGGPDASRCMDCHWKGGFAGAGDRADNAAMFGDGDSVMLHDQRNPPSLWGAGWTEAIGREMSIELQSQAETLRADAAQAGEAISRRLSAKGVDFGVLTVSSAGLVDAAGLIGVDADLIIKPFGWKGTSATIRDFSNRSLHLHHGLQSDALLADPGDVVLGDGPADDPDGDGVRDEFTDVQLDALVTFIATLDVPTLSVPTDGGAFGPPLTGQIEIVDAPEFTARWLDGAVLFDDLGCAGCHVPLMPLDDPRLAVGDGWIDLMQDAARPHPVPNADGRVLVPVFSDFKRHDMGDGLASRHVDAGVGRREYLTRRLWGVANTSPYLHDGRAITYDEAIGSHGGEAAGAAAAFNALSPADQASVRVFLIGLKRGPALRVR
ncbi:MAG: hypothetical protein ACI9U2_001392 [Bradymonadia bacterium]|jgi:hypothetical protein